MEDRYEDRLKHEDRFRSLEIKEHNRTSYMGVGN